MNPTKMHCLWIAALFGWVLALVLLVLITPRIIRKFTAQLPSSRPANWSSILQTKIDDVSGCRWTDSRPLYVFAGDSHVEMGDWYSLFRGRFAVRNCGLSGAGIEDVDAIVSSIPNQKVQCLILMCGINDLTSGVAVSDCMESYKRLLHSGQCHSAIQSLAAVSIMPVRSSPIDSRSHAVNREVAKFNEQLKRICSESNVKFIDVSGTFSTNGGSLPMDFTQDGLHLNAKGYRVLADRLSASINQVGQLPTP